VQVACQLISAAGTITGSGRCAVHRVGAVILFEIAVPLNASDS
jgi:hypothetical protein